MTQNPCENLPQRYCWSRYGTESGETIESILERKERERAVSGGIFLWGIGNSVAPGLKELVRLDSRPMAVFSPMRSKPRTIDVVPGRVVAWKRATGLDGQDWDMPEGISVVSRFGTGAGRVKCKHYALVCRSVRPLRECTADTPVDLAGIVNLLSGNPLGHSQVTAVVQRLDTTGARRQLYPVGFAVELTYPYFVELTDPVTLDSSSDLASAANKRNANQAR